ncbi:unnamed protein product [Spirodela intermedia]|uniref:Uncharacterized protein n=1 Tax=Spirodela intermedia TaxID=51605 RepID=A0ABN7E9Y5_SPIIN|nr:unnamed protein product [Spirodela intermedia]
MEKRKEENEEREKYGQPIFLDECEVATRLPADRPLLNDGLFVDQSEMIYSMDFFLGEVLSRVRPSCPTAG